MSEPTTPTGPDLAAGIDGGTLAEGVPLVGHVHGEPVLLVRTAEAILAVGATCSHYGGPLGEGLVVGDTIRCPWHHACFNLRTGAVERAPALNPIPCYRVETAGALIRVIGRDTSPPKDVDRIAGMDVLGDAISPGIGPGASAPSRPEGAGAGRDTAEISSIVIVGAGAAGNSAAERLRQLGFRGRLRMLGRDQAAPYDRPNLSKDFLAGAAPEEWIPLRPREFYAEHDIVLETGVTVSEIDPLARNVELSDTRRIVYDRLLLATGAEPALLAVPGAGAHFVHVLRTLEDCRGLIAAAGTARHVVIVGSGFIGLEAAAALRARNLSVAVVSPDSEPLAQVVGAEVGAFLRGLHQEQGVTFHLGQTVTAIEPGAVVTASGLRLPADLVLVAIGVRPAVSLAGAAGVAVEQGILVDEYLETSVPGIFAAGDVARFPDPRSGGRIRVEHWVVAERMGATAAANMLGARQKFEDVPFFWSVHYDVTLSYVGHAGGVSASGPEGGQVEQIVQIAIDGSLAKRDCRVSYTRGKRLAAVLTIGRDREGLAAERAFETVG